MVLTSSSPGIGHKPPQSNASFVAMGGIYAVPPELVILIFNELDVQSLLRCKRVCHTLFKLSIQQSLSSLAGLSAIQQHR
jgi:hypothetical protein